MWKRGIIHQNLKIINRAQLDIIGVISLKFERNLCCSLGVMVHTASAQMVRQDAPPLRSEGRGYKTFFNQMKQISNNGLKSGTA